MFSKNFFFLLLLLLILKLGSSSNDSFSFNGFSSSGTNLHLDGLATITNNGLLMMANSTGHMKAHAFYPTPFHFKSSHGKILSFSTTFVFAIQPLVSTLGGDGLAFVISHTTNFSSALPTQYLGLFNTENNGNPNNHVFAVELDTIQNPEFQDIDGNHVGIDIDSLRSNSSSTAGYYDDSTGVNKSLILFSGQQMQVWIDFDGEDMQLNVTLSPVRMQKPMRPLLSSTVNLTSLMLDLMYVGFSSSTGSINSNRYILGWSFSLNGVAEALDYDKLPVLPVVPSGNERSNSLGLAMWLPIGLSLFMLLTIAVAVVAVRTRIKYAELLEDWELEYGPHRFKYKDLFRAANGFTEKELLGSGGFGRVYRGVLPSSNVEVAVKRVSHDSRQGMREFVAEIVSIGQLRHRNIVQLLGYCRRKGELLLVYDYMPNSSLDKFLYNHRKPTLDWAQRFRIIKGVASGLLYLHEDWEQVVVHRDIKASNVLLDGELNGRLGDFGLARLYERGADPHTTRVVGTMGYLAPELPRTGKATTATDVFAFGAFLLEVACGRRPVELQAEGEKLILMDWVLASWQRGSMLETRDSRFGDEYCVHEVELVLKLGLLCCNPVPAARPSMRQVVLFLEGDTALPELPESYMSLRSLSLFRFEGPNSFVKSSSSSPLDNLSISGAR